MPSPGRRGGSKSGKSGKSGQSGPRGGSRKGMSKADMDKLAKMEAKMNKEIAKQSKKDIAKYGSVREADKARKSAYDKTGKDPRGKWKSKSPTGKYSSPYEKSSDASKTAGENKTKRTGPTRIGGSPGSALARALLSGRYSR